MPNPCHAAAVRLPQTLARWYAFPLTFRACHLMNRFSLLLAISLAAIVSPRASSASEDDRCQAKTLRVLEDVIGRDKIKDILAHSCRLSPGGDHLIATAAYQPHDYKESDNLPFLVVLLKDNHRPVAKYLGEIVVDATVYVQARSLEIDTGRYNLAPGVRAFGLRLRATRTPKCAEATTDRNLTLFIQEGHRLRPVLGPTPTYYSVARDGAFCTPDVIVDDWNMLLSINDHQSNGFRDIAARFKSSTAKDIGCTFKYSAKSKRYHANECYVAHIPVR